MDSLQDSHGSAQSSSQEILTASDSPYEERFNPSYVASQIKYFILGTFGELKGCISSRGTWIGICFGDLLCLMNIYFGLKTGHFTGFPIAVILLSWAVGQCVSSPLTMNEHITAYVVSTTVGAIALPSGLMGIIPAVRYLLTSEEGEVVRLTTGQLVGFTLSMSLPAPFLAAAIYPVLHKLDFSQAKMEAGIMNGLRTEDTPNSSRARLFKFPSIAAGAAAIVNIIEYLAKLDSLVRRFPLGLIGLGLILLPSVILSLVLGSIGRWFLLPRRSTSLWWSVKPSGVQDQDANRRIIIGAMTVIAADFGVLVLYAVLFRPLKGTWQYILNHRRMNIGLRVKREDANGAPSAPDERSLLVGGDAWSPRYHVATDGGVSGSQNAEDTHASDMEDHPFPIHTSLAQGGWALLVFTICTITFDVSVHGQKLWLAMTLTPIISILMGVSAVYLMGVTSQNHASAFGKSAQFVFVGLCFSCLHQPGKDSPVILVLYSGGRAGAVACLSADLANTMAIAKATGASLRGAVCGQIIAILIGCPLAVLWFVLISWLLVDADPSKSPFAMPTAHLYVESARLALQDDWSKGMNLLIVCLGVAFLVFSALKRAFPTRSKWIPNGAAFALALYLPGSQVACMSIGFTLGWAMEGYRTGSWITVPSSDIVPQEKGLIGGGLMFGESLTQVVLNLIRSILS